MRLSAHAPAFLLALTGSLLSCAAAGAPIIERAGSALDPETWAKDVDRPGATWLVEHFSPYCSHCRSFAPTWKEFVSENEQELQRHNFFLGQLDCVAYGDLCHAHDVAYYPSLFIYKDGERVDEFKGARSKDRLREFVDGHVVESAPAHAAAAGDDAAEESLGSANDEDGPQPQPQPRAREGTDDSRANAAAAAAAAGVARGGAAGGGASSEQRTKVPSADGRVHAVDSGTLASIKKPDYGPAFVKFYAPWCGHCKTLAPKWAEMAERLEGEVHVYEVDCDASSNSAACSSEQVNAYPTLVFYHDGAVVQYRGARETEPMVEFARRAAQATRVEPVNSVNELETLVDDGDDASFLYVHPPDVSKADMKLFTDVARLTLGGPRYFTASSSEVFDRLHLARDAPALVLFKRGSGHEPYAVLAPLPAAEAPRARERTLAWIERRRRGLLATLDSATHTDIYSDSPPGIVNKQVAREHPQPLVVVVAVSAVQSPEHEASVKRARDAAVRFAKLDEVKRASGLERDVQFVLVDGDRWRGWLNSMYGLANDPKDKQSKTHVVVADPATLSYWTTTTGGEAFSLSSVDRLYETVDQAIRPGKLPGLSSRNFVERWALSWVDGVTSAVSTASARPVLTLVTVVSFVALAYLLTRRATRRRVLTSRLRSSGPNGAISGSFRSGYGQSAPPSPAVGGGYPKFE